MARVKSLFQRARTRHAALASSSTSASTRLAGPASISFQIVHRPTRPLRPLALDEVPSEKECYHLLRALWADAERGASESTEHDFASTTWHDAPTREGEVPVTGIEDNDGTMFPSTAHYNVDGTVVAIPMYRVTERHGDDGLRMRLVEIAPRKGSGSSERSGPDSQSNEGSDGSMKVDDDKEKEEKEEDVYSGWAEYYFDRDNFAAAQGAEAGIVRGSWKRTVSAVLECDEGGWI